MLSLLALLSLLAFGAALQPGNLVAASPARGLKSAAILSTKHAAPPSLMVQVSTLAPAYTPADLVAWLGRVCQAPANRGGTLVLQDVATPGGTLLTSYIDAIVGFLPGEARDPCFGRVFVGTVEAAWSGPGNAEVQGIVDPAFVKRYLEVSAAVAGQFVARYPKVVTNWYVSYEANLNELYYPQVQSAYSSMLGSALRTFARLRPHAQVMWSPAFWYPYSVYSHNALGMAGLRRSLTGLFAGLSSHGGGIAVLDLQDYVAGSSCQPSDNRMTPADAVDWVHFLESLGVIPEVVINTEQFSIDCATGGIGAGNPTEVLGRESFYRSQGVALGPAFEIRYWMVTHGLV